MNEELEKEAEEWLCNNLHSASEEDFIKAMIDIAEPREKQIAELEAQIEKMKCCQNCDNWNWKHSKCEKKLKGDCFKHSKWVMRNF